MSGNPFDNRMYYGTTDYIQEKEIDLDSSDEEIEEYIENRRSEFYEEWFKYINED